MKTDKKKMLFPKKKERDPKENFRTVDEKNLRLWT